MAAIKDFGNKWKFHEKTLENCWNKLNKNIFVKIRKDIWGMIF